jgi:diguanylate cyclase (GGDEF)-like protein
MPSNTATRYSAFRSIARAGNRVAHAISLYVVPLAIAMLSVLTLAWLPEQLQDHPGRTLPISVSDQFTPAHSPTRVLETLSREPTSYTTALDSPAWILMRLGHSFDGLDKGISIQGPLSSHATCWNADTMKPLGSTVSARAESEALQTTRRGIALFIDAEAQPHNVLCHINFIDEGQVYAQMWPESHLYRQMLRYERGVSLLEGGLLTIALFILIIGLTNRESIYLILAAWMVGNLRMGALAMGWDDQWLGHRLPIDWLPFIRQVTVAAYYLLSCALFSNLLRESAQSSFQGALRVAQLIGLVLLVAAFVLPTSVFEPFMWAAAAYGLLLTAVLLARCIYRARASRVWLLHIVLFGMALCVMLSGIMIVLFGRSEFVDLFNGVIALLLSNLMVALAVSERMREDRRSKVRAQTALISNHAMTPIGMFTLNNDDVFQNANPVIEQMLGFNLEDGDIVRWTDYFEPINWAELAQKTQNGEAVEVHVKNDAVKADQPQHFIIRATVSNGQIEGSLQDVTARTRTIHQLGLLAFTDPLTESLNRRGIEKAIDESLQDLPSGAPCALAYLNLRHFKRINDLFGHTTGDEILKQVCSRVNKAISARQLGRVGGDEFIVLFPNTHLDDAKRLGAAIIDSITVEPFHVGSRAFQISGTMGLIALKESMTSNDAISAANHACRDARKRRQDIVVYEQDSLALQEHTEELRIFDQIEGGDAPSGLHLDMQPIMSLKAPLDSINFEVLLRVRDSSGTPIPSGKFISSAEESGTITTLDRWVFTATLEWMAKHEQRLSRTQFVNINLSGVSLSDEKFITSLFGLLSRYEHLCNKLYVEVTEGVALQNLSRTSELVSRLGSMGVRVALDDFGAGYTSFSYLKELPADAIKIDGSLIRDMLKSETNTAIVRAIVQLAQSLNKQSIAEWVEDYPTLMALRDMGVDFVQGYVVSKARPSVDILNAHSITDLVTNRDTLNFIKNSGRIASTRF